MKPPVSRLVVFLSRKKKIAPVQQIIWNQHASWRVFLCPNTSKAINCSVTGDTEDNGSQ
nr:MAG TPA: hypothetical protein [Caudoviricetes sp.]DAP39111.1 MAG TPA: hypothetical protein [Caudoviricetes sp.]DAQ33843.1 MAG TPA: hypothetical protein [Caudoviricetes sp.]DAS74886.1 MAG TPA: hypothetical protein [Caudoviricetes sp.]DAW50766.1 MAG TPA: hypothetical protein [Caudoviricetes sp.]